MTTAPLAPLATLVRGLESINEAAGRVAAWLTLGTVLLCFLVVVLRYGFAFGQVWMQELYVWFHALVFLIGAGYTLKHHGHVRVDVLYQRFSPRRRAWIEIIGTVVFLTPWMVVLWVYGLPFAVNAQTIGETSGQPGGMQALWLLKAAIPAFVVLIALQGIAIIGRAVLGLVGHPDFPLTEEEAELRERPIG